MLHGRFHTRIFRPAVVAAGIDPRLRLHDLRHTCAALLIAQGAHQRAFMERLGLSSIVVTMNVYGHLPPSLDDTIASGLDATLLGAGAAWVRPELAAVVGSDERNGLRPADSLEAGSGIEPLCEVLQTSA